MILSTLKNLQVLMRWARNPTIVVPLLFVSLGSIKFMPPNFNWLFWQRGLAALGQLLVGILEIPLAFLLATASDSQLLGYYFFYVTVLFVFGLSVGLFTWALWQLGCWGRSVLAVVLAANSLVGCFWTLWINMPVEPPMTCERFLSSENGVRIMAYPEMGAFPDTIFFLLITQDSGRSWREVMFSWANSYSEPNCENIKSLDDAFIWVWTDWDVGVTHDGGTTWHVRHLQCDMGSIRDCQYVPVESVEFSDKQHGRIKVYPSDVSELITEDGGQTWIPAR